MGIRNLSAVIFFHIFCPVFKNLLCGFCQRISPDRQLSTIYVSPDRQLSPLGEDMSVPVCRPKGEVDVPVLPVPVTRPILSGRSESVFFRMDENTHTNPLSLRGKQQMPRGQDFNWGNSAQGKNSTQLPVPREQVEVLLTVHF